MYRDGRPARTLPSHGGRRSSDGQVQGRASMKFEEDGRTASGWPSAGGARRTSWVSTGAHRSDNWVTLQARRELRRSPTGRHRRHYSRPGRVARWTPRHNGAGSMDRDVWRDTTPMANRSTAKHFREKPRDRSRLQRAATTGAAEDKWRRPLRDRPLPHRAHRNRKRPRRALPGMMLHQDGSSSRVGPAVDGGT